MQNNQIEQDKEIREELNSLYTEFGYIYKDYCSKEQHEELAKLKKEGQPLPDNLCYDPKQDKLYYSIPSGLAADELNDLTRLRMLKYTRSISYGVNFIVVVIILWFIVNIFVNFMSVH
jgi:glucose-6-phosphate 1-dehydrogenase